MAALIDALIAALRLCLARRELPKSRKAHIRRLPRNKTSLATMLILDPLARPLVSLLCIITVY